MLHAILHGKIDESVPEPQRREDSLTSTVFGTLVLVDAREDVLRWLGDAVGLHGDRLATPCETNEMECWFWPRLRFAEPDVVLRIGDRLFVVEAKLASGRHDLALGEDEGRVTDQLVRQWQSVQPELDAVNGYSPGIRRAVHECEITLVYLFSGRRARTARGEASESLERLPVGADLKLLTWQQLYRRLQDSPYRWARDLCQYLELAGLAAFCGFHRGISDPASFAPLATWRAGSQTRVPSGLRVSVRPVHDHAHALQVLCRSFRVSGGTRSAMGMKAACKALLPTLEIQSGIRQWTTTDKRSAK